MSALKCSSCGSELPEGARFCPSCGEKAGEKQQTGGSGIKIVCGNCGSENETGVQYCASCGNRLAAVASTKAERSDIAQKNERTEPQRPAPQPATKKGKVVIRRRKIESWHIAVVLSIVTIVVVVLYYQERSKNSETATPAAGPGPEAVNAVINQLEDAVKLNPNDPVARLHLANALQDAKRFPQAVTEYQKYLAITPRDVNARVDMGVCYFDMGDTKAAMAAMQEGLKIDPKHQMAMFNLGIVNLQVRNIDEARSWFQKTSAIDSTTDVGRRAKMMIQQHSF